MIFHVRLRDYMYVISGASIWESTGGISGAGVCVSSGAGIWVSSHAGICVSNGASICRDSMTTMDSYRKPQQLELV